MLTEYKCCNQVIIFLYQFKNFETRYLKMLVTLLLHATLITDCLKCWKKRASKNLYAPYWQLQMAVRINEEHEKISEKHNIVSRERLSEAFNPFIYSEEGKKGSWEENFRALKVKLQRDLKA